MTTNNLHITTKTVAITGNPHLGLYLFPVVLCLKWPNYVWVEPVLYLTNDKMLLGCITNEVNPRRIA